MGLLNRILKRNLTEEERQAASRREKEWLEKCHSQGERFAGRIGLDKGVARVNDFANTYPRTFFAMLFGVLGTIIVLNLAFSWGGGLLSGQVDTLQQVTVPDMALDDGRQKVLSGISSVAAELRRIDGDIQAILARDTLTRQDSLDLHALLLQADALQRILDGKGILPAPADSVAN